jgi:hypothetical protein
MMVELKGWRQRIWRGSAGGGRRWRRCRRRGPQRNHLSRRRGPQRALRGAGANLCEGRDGSAGPRLQHHGNKRPDLWPAPIWVPPTGGGAARIIVATESDFVYALNAATGAQIWSTSLGTAVPAGDLPCGNIQPTEDVTGTPTIDPTRGIVYLEAYVETAAGPRHKVFGLSLATGDAAPGWPIDVKDGLDALGQGFNNRPQGQRSALALVHGNLYVPYAGHFGDCGTYNGMVVGLDLANPRVFAAWSTKITGGGSWGQSGVSFDGTSMFVTTGNTFSASSSSWGGGEAVIRLGPRLANPTQDADYCAPRRREEEVLM